MITASSFDEAAKATSENKTIGRRLGTGTRVWIASGHRLKVYDGTGKFLAGGSLRRPIPIPPGVYDSDGRGGYRQVLRAPDGKVLLTEGSVASTGREYNFDDEIDPAARPGVRKVSAAGTGGFLVVPSLTPQPAPSGPAPALGSAAGPGPATAPPLREHRKKPPPLPEAAPSSAAEPTANTTAYPAELKALTPAVAPIGSTGSFLMRLHKAGDMKGADAVANAFQPVAFNWEVVRVHPNAPHPEAGTQSSTVPEGEGVPRRIGKGLLWPDMDTAWTAAYRRRLVELYEDYEDNAEGRGLIAKLGLAWFASARMRLALVGESASRFVSAAAGEGDPTMQSYAEVPWNVPQGLYFLSATATPVAVADAPVRRASSVRGVYVDVLPTGKVADHALARREPSPLLMVAVLVSSVTGTQIPLDLAVSHRRLGSSGDAGPGSVPDAVRRAVFAGENAFEVTIVDRGPHGRTLTGYGRTLGQAWADALETVRLSLGRGRGTLAYRPPAAYAELEVDARLRSPMKLSQSGLSQAKEMIADLSTIGGSMSVALAPFTGGASLAATPTLFGLSKASSLVNIGERAYYGNLEPDMELLGDLLNVTPAKLGRVQLSKAVEIGYYGQVLGQLAAGLSAPSTGDPLEDRSRALGAVLNAVMTGLVILAAHHEVREEEAPAGPDEHILPPLPVPAPAPPAHQPGRAAEPVRIGSEGARPAEPAPPARTAEPTPTPRPVPEGTASGARSEVPAPAIAPRPAKSPPTPPPPNRAEQLRVQLRKLVEAREAAAAAASVVAGTHPQMSGLVANHPKAIKALLAKVGNWKSLLSSLGRQRANPQLAAIGEHCVAFREALKKVLSEKFDARPPESESTEWASDTDLNVYGPNAGAKLIAAEKWLAKEVGPNWSDALAVSFQVETSRVLAYREVLPTMEPSAAEALQGRIDRLTELYSLTRMRQHTGGHDKFHTAAVDELARSLNIEPAALEKLAPTDESMRIARRNVALLHADALRAAQNVATGAKAVELAEQLTMVQMRANLYTPDAYPGPGAVRQIVDRLPINAHEAYQAAWSHTEMLSHTLAHGRGNVMAASRDYTIYKYMSRLAEAARTQGLNDPTMRFLSRLSLMIYGANRDAHREGGHELPLNEKMHEKMSKQNEKMLLAGEHVPIPHSSPTTEAQPAFLLDTFRSYMKRSREALVQLRPPGLPAEVVEPPTPAETADRPAATSEPPARRIRETAGRPPLPEGVPPAGIKGAAEMGRLMEWGKTMGGVGFDLTERIATLSRDELMRKGVSLADAMWWRDLVRWHTGDRPSNQAAPGRYLLMQKAVELLGGE